MRGSPRTIIVVVVLVTLAAIGLNRWLVHDWLANATSSLFVVPGSVFTTRMSQIHILLESWHTNARLTVENAALRREHLQLSALAGQIQKLQEENTFLRKAANMILPAGKRRIDARLSFSTSSTIRSTIVLNRGQDDGVRQGDVVISSERVLIGRVEAVFVNTARVQLITDPKFSATGRVLQNQTRGIVRGTGGDTLRFELIGHDDMIDQGSVVVSSGDDRIPAGLVIGTVSVIQPASGSIFKKVDIQPAARDIIIGPVIILEP